MKWLRLECEKWITICDFCNAFILNAFITLIKLMFENDRINSLSRLRYHFFCVFFGWMVSCGCVWACVYVRRGYVRVWNNDSIQPFSESLFTFSLSVVSLYAHIIHLILVQCTIVKVNISASSHPRGFRENSFENGIHQSILFTAHFRIRCSLLQVGNIYGWMDFNWMSFVQICKVSSIECQRSKITVNC